MGTGPLRERDLIINPLQNLKILVPRYKTPIRDSLYLHPLTLRNTKKIPQK